LQQYIDGVQFVQKGDIIIFNTTNFDPEQDATNFYKQECRGLVVDLHKDKLMYYGIPYYSPKKPTWPTDNEEFLKRYHNTDSLFGLFTHDGEIYLTQPSNFVDDSVKANFFSLFDVSKINLNEYWFVLRIPEFQTWASSNVPQNVLKVYLLAMRHRYSYLLANEEIVKDEAIKVGFFS